MKSLSKQLLESIRGISEASDKIYDYLQSKIPNNSQLSSIDRNVTFSQAYDALLTGKGLGIYLKDYTEGKDLDELVDIIVKGIADNQGITQNKLFRNINKAQKEKDRQEKKRKAEIAREERNAELLRKYEKNKEIVKNGGFVYSKGETIACENDENENIVILDNGKDLPKDKEFIKYAGKYRKEPEDLDYAASYAYRESIRNSEPMIIYAGNYHMNFLWRISNIDDFKLGNCNNRELKGYLVTPSGKYYQIKSK